MVQTGSRSTQESQDPDAWWVATEEHGAFWKSWQSRGKDEGGHQKPSIAVIQRFAYLGILEEDNSRKTAKIRKVLEKGRHNSKNKAKKPSSMKQFLTPFLRCQNLH